MTFLLRAILLIAFAAATARAQFASGQVYDGHGQTITAPLRLTLSGTTITNYTFTQTLVVSGSSGLTFRGCTFRDISGRAIDYFGGLTDSTIAGCTFTNVQGDAAILGWNARRCTITGNRFVKVREGIHGFWGGNRDGPDDCKITGNYFEQIAHFALEQQGNPNGLEIAGNYVASWVTGPSQMGFSIATGGDHGGIDLNRPDGGDTSHRVHVHHNYIGGDGLRSDTKQDQYAALEFMGWDNECDHNWVWGQWDCLILIGLNGPTQMRVHENVTCGGPIRRLISGEDRYQPLVDANHFKNDRVPDGTPPPTFAQVLAAAGLGDAIAPAGTRPTISDLAGTVTAPGTIRWTWTPLAIPLDYVARATHGDQVFAHGTLPAGKGSGSIGDLPDNWEVDLILSSGGQVVAKNTTQYRASLVPQASRPAIRTVNVPLWTGDNGATWHVGPPPG